MIAEKVGYMTDDATIHVLEHVKHTLQSKGWTRRSYKKGQRVCVLGAIALHTCGLHRHVSVYDQEEGPFYTPDIDSPKYFEYGYVQRELEATLEERGLTSSVSDWQDEQASKKGVIELIDATIERLQTPDPDPWPDPREPLEPLDPRGPLEPRPDPLEPDDEPVPAPV